VTDISHLLFTYDTLIFCGTVPYHLRLLSCLFLYLEVVLGLKINLAKSELVLVGIINNVEGLTRILGCRVSSLPMKYLGLPLSASFKIKSI
jgi:small basic protein